jgi:hypothetical protein
MRSRVIARCVRDDNGYALGTCPRCVSIRRDREADLAAIEGGAHRWAPAELQPSLLASVLGATVWDGDLEWDDDANELEWGAPIFRAA